MFATNYLVEILTPKRTESDPPKSTLALFAERCCRIFDAGLGISVPDNPMGQPRLSLIETLEAAGLAVPGTHAVMNLNTFHTKAELDSLLVAAARVGIRYLLVVRGDGGPLLSKLEPAAIGGKHKVATSIDLIGYINREYGGQFVTGAAFNQYSPMPLERNRLEQKIAAGARFVITQPVIGRDAEVDALFDFGLPVVVEAWMSTNVELLFKSVRRPKDERAESFDPAANLEVLHAAYPDSCIYLSMLPFKRRWKHLLPRL